MCAWVPVFITASYHIDGLVQERRNSIANALEFRLSCTNPLLWYPGASPVSLSDGISAKPLSLLILACHQFDMQCHIIVKFQLKLISFHAKKFIDPIMTGNCWRELNLNMWNSFKYQIYSYFESCLGFGLTQVDKINSGATIHVICPTQPIPCLLMIWWL